MPVLHLPVPNRCTCFTSLASKQKSVNREGYLVGSATGLGVSGKGRPKMEGAVVFSLRIWNLASIMTIVTTVLRRNGFSKLCLYDGDNRPFGRIQLFEKGGCSVGF